MRRFFILLFLILLTSCSFTDLGSGNQISVGTWNVQTFFDGEIDGCEYQEFRKSENWNREKYLERLVRLCEVIMELDADVIVLEELENEGILYDINNQLAGANWNQKKNWSYGCFAKNKGDSIGCGILSRFELTDMKVHNLDIKVEGKNQPAMRPMVEVQLKAGEKQFVLLANHWKSKSGGEESSNCWREWQESILGNRIKDLLERSEGNCGVIACGDFNRDLFEFEKSTGNMVNLCIHGNQYGQDVQNCWFDKNGELICDNGSYFYQNNWERIDHFFVSDNVKIEDFTVFAKEPWCDVNGVPLGYKIYTGQGYSDHVPLKCVISF